MIIPAILPARGTDDVERPIVASRSMPSIPRAVPASAVRQLLAAINRRSAVGRRDYATVLLLACLGLRANEVVSLELGDIDWEAGDALHFLSDRYRRDPGRGVRAGPQRSCLVGRGRLIVPVTEGRSRDGAFIVPAGVAHDERLP